MRPISLHLLGAVIALLLIFLNGSSLSAAEPSPGSPPCEEFFDKWEAPNVSPGMLAMAGIGRELAAAADCVRKNDVATACAHWRKILEVTDRLGAPLSENRIGVETQMHDHRCDSVAPFGPAEPAAEPDATEQDEDF